MTSEYGLLGRVGMLGNWVRSRAVVGIFLLCVCDQVFSLATSCSGMLNLGLYHCEYIFWDVAWEDLSGICWWNVVF
eukprot:2318714-Ditylum_brightwellii.AAC.1